LRKAGRVLLFQAAKVLKYLVRKC